MKQQTKAILARVLEIQAELDVRKALYEELDMLTMQLQDEGFQRELLGDCTIELVDNFATSNTAFRPAGVKRFELRVKRTTSKTSKSSAGGAA